MSKEAKERLLNRPNFNVSRALRIAGSVLAIAGVGVLAKADRTSQDTSKLPIRPPKGPTKSPPMLIEKVKPNGPLISTPDGTLRFDVKRKAGGEIVVTELPSDSQSTRVTPPNETFKFKRVKRGATDIRTGSIQSVRIPSPETMTEIYKKPNGKVVEKQELIKEGVNLRLPSDDEGKLLNGVEPSAELVTHGDPAGVVISGEGKDIAIINPGPAIDIYPYGQGGLQAVRATDFLAQSPDRPNR